MYASKGAEALNREGCIAMILLQSLPENLLAYQHPARQVSTVLDAPAITRWMILRFDRVVGMAKPDVQPYFKENEVVHLIPKLPRKC